MKMNGLYLEDLSVGQSAERTYAVTQEAIEAFAEISGDRNPVHLDEAYASTTAFKGRIAHGVLSASYLSAVLGMDLPGPGAVYLSQTLNFKRPVRGGDTLVARAQVKAIDLERSRVTLTTQCFVGGKIVLDGEAVVLAPRRPSEAPLGGAH